MNKGIGSECALCVKEKAKSTKLVTWYIKPNNISILIGEALVHV